MFVEPGTFDFVSILESHWKDIRDEYLALSEDVFDPWVQREMYGTGWTVYGLFFDGERIPGACSQCPKTAALLDGIKGLSLAGFSRMASGAHITPHVGWAKSVYRLHLGLVVPPNCNLRVGNETRQWEEGKCLIFDDTVEHEAWNKSDQMRGTLLLDFLRPGIASFDGDQVPDEVRQYSNDLAKK